MFGRMCQLLNGVKVVKKGIHAHCTILLIFYFVFGLLCFVSIQLYFWWFFSLSMCSWFVRYLWPGPMYSAFFNQIYCIFHREFTESKRKWWKFEARTKHIVIEYSVIFHCYYYYLIKFQNKWLYIDLVQQTNEITLIKTLVAWCICWTFTSS